MVKITVAYVDCETNCPVGTKVFCGKDLTEASVLAANFQSAHPEMHENGFNISK